ncbi:glycosyltransferase family 17 protein [Flammula alnicola]|nr:glycosyltransferase family 17 protein [Flammula alnicola]
MAFLFRRSRSTVTLILATLFTVFLLYGIVQNQYQLKNLLSYSTRPLWDKNAGPNEIIPHFYGEGMTMDSHTCDLHGFTERSEKDNVKQRARVLEIRLNELDSVVDFFLIVESNASFTGLPKETFFANNRERFAKFEHKIVYSCDLPGYPLRPGQSAWDVEAHTRNTMTMLIRSHLSTFAANTRSLVLMSDLDEIPARHTVDLLKHCDFGPSIHLQLRDYLYSFEWYLGLTSWRASAQMWNPNSYYRHSKSGERILADAGWHCSYCFKTIPEYALKMQGFSHADRIAGRDSRYYCRGKDIFGMLPEAYSYVDLLSQMSLQPLKSAVGLPRYLIENSAKFRFCSPSKLHWYYSANLTEQERM